MKAPAQRPTWRLSRMFWGIAVHTMSEAKEEAKELVQISVKPNSKSSRTPRRSQKSIWKKDFANQCGNHGKKRRKPLKKEVRKEENRVATLKKEDLKPFNLWQKGHNTFGSEATPLYRFYSKCFFTASGFLKACLQRNVEGKKLAGHLLKQWSEVDLGHEVRIDLGTS